VLEVGAYPNLTAYRRIYIDRRLVATPKFVIASLRRLFGWAV